MRRFFSRLLEAFGLVRLARLEAAERDLHLAQRRAAKLEQVLAQTRASAEEAEKRYREDIETARQKFTERMTSMKTTIEQASRAQTLSDNQLALVESKLDVIEGAIQALDQRTRDVLIARTTEASDVKS